MSHFPSITPRSPQSPSGVPAPPVAQPLPPPSTAEEARLAHILSELQHANVLHRRSMNRLIGVQTCTAAAVLAVLSCLAADAPIALGAGAASLGVGLLGVILAIVG